MEPVRSFSPNFLSLLKILFLVEFDNGTFLGSLQTTTGKFYFPFKISTLRTLENLENKNVGQCFSTGVTTLNKVLCQFPFYYEKNLYTECTTSGLGEKWCPTQTVETYYNGSWGACPGELFGEKIKTFLFIIFITAW